MNEKDEATGAVELIDEQTEFTLAELCRSRDVQAEFVEAHLRTIGAGRMR